MFPPGIHITGDPERFRILRRYKPGQKLEMKIIQRQDSHRALVEIQGQRFTAEFKTGMPATDSLILSVAEKIGNSILLRLTEPLPRALSELLNGILFHRSGSIMDIHVPLLRNLIDSGKFSLFALNSLILNRGQSPQRSDLFALLKTRGLSGDKLFLVLCVMLNSRLGQGAFPLLALLSKWDRKNRQGPSLDSFEEGDYGIFESLCEEGREDLFRYVFESIFPEPLGPAGYRTTRLYYESEGFKNLDIIESTGSCIVSVEFEPCGRVEVIGRMKEDVCECDCFCDDPGLYSGMLEISEEMLEAIKSKSVKINFRLWKSAMILDKIKNILSRYSQGGEVDYRV